jgi:hypothetical protein
MLESKGSETIANDAIVVAGLVSATAPGIRVCVQTGITAGSARAPLVRVDLPGVAAAHGWCRRASSRFLSVGYEAFRREGADNAHTAAACG